MIRIGASVGAVIAGDTNTPGCVSSPTPSRSRIVALSNCSGLTIIECTAGVFVSRAASTRQVLLTVGSPPSVDHSGSASGSVSPRGVNPVGRDDSFAPASMYDLNCA